MKNKFSIVHTKEKERYVVRENEISFYRELQFSLTKGEEKGHTIASVAIAARNRCLIPSSEPQCGSHGLRRFESPIG